MTTAMGSEPMAAPPEPTTLCRPAAESRASKASLAPMANPENAGQHEAAIRSSHRFRLPARCAYDNQEQLGRWGARALNVSRTRSFVRPGTFKPEPCRRQNIR